MSMRTRARHLQRATGLTYQQALARLRSLGAAPAELSRRTRWPLGRCDLFLVDRALDPEWREVAARSPNVEEAVCANCGCRYFHGGEEQRLCSACRAQRPIEVVESPRLVGTELERICDELLQSSNAHSVVVVDDHGRELARAGTTNPGVRMFAALHLGVRRRVSEMLTVDEMIIRELDGTHALAMVALARRALLWIVFDNAATSAGLIRLRVRRALPELERALAAPRFSGAPPSSSGGPTGSGSPAEIAVGAQRRRS